MAIEEKEQQETLLKDLIEKVEKDPLPTNIFDISETDPLVLLGKMNEIISKLKAINALIASSDSKASEALSNAITALSKSGEALGRAINAENLSQDATDKADLAISDALSAVSTAQEALSKAETADSTAIEAINDATQALSLANEALSTANTANTTANTANTTANTANTTANTANTTAIEAKTSAQNAVELATSAEETAGNASMQATDASNKSTEALSKSNQALTTAQEALQQVTEGLGTKVYDNHNNLMSNAKFTGHNGVNVDMSESDPETFDIRLDNSITSAIEDNHTQGQTNKANIEALTTRVTTDESNISGLTSRVTANEGDIIELTNMLSATEELAQNATDEITNTINPKLISLEAKDTEQDAQIGSKINKTFKYLKKSPIKAWELEDDIYLIEGSTPFQKNESRDYWSARNSGFFIKNGSEGLFINENATANFSIYSNRCLIKESKIDWTYLQLVSRTNGSIGTYTLSHPINDFRAILVIANFADGGLEAHILPSELLLDIVRIGGAKNRLLITSDIYWADFQFSTSQVQLKAQKSLSGFMVYGVN